MSQYEYSTAKQNRLLRFYTLCLEILGNIDVIKIKPIIDSYPFMIMAFFHSNNCNSLSFGHLLFFKYVSTIVIDNPEEIWQLLFHKDPSERISAQRTLDLRYTWYTFRAAYNIY